MIHELLTGVPPFLASSTNAIFTLIAENRPALGSKEKLPTAARDIVRQLILPDVAKRATLESVREHKWFKGVDWAAAKARKGAAPFADHASECAKELIDPPATPDETSAGATALRWCCCVH